MTPEPEHNPSNASETPLQGWKDIAAYLERDERTARRWESEDGLPIRRYRADRRSGVYAYLSEIEEWRASRPVSGEAAIEADAARLSEFSGQPRTLVLSGAAAVLLLAGFFYVVRSPELNPFVEAQSGIVTTEIFHGDTVGKVSPDGRYLSETDWANGDIGIRDLQSGEFRHLGDKTSWEDGIGEADASIFSPDGQQIAYCWLVGEPGDWRYELRTIEVFAENPQARVVLADTDINWIEPEAWTRDGRILAWVSRRTADITLAFVSVESGALDIVKSFDPEVIAGTWSAALSPDEAWIAYHAGQVGTGAQPTPEDIFVLSADGRTQNQITTHPGSDRVMGFSPDSTTLLFLSDRTGNSGLWGVPIIDGDRAGDPSLLLRDVGNAESLGVLADGSVTYVRSIGSRDLVSAEIDIATGKLIRTSQVLETQRLGSNTGPWFSPDESKFAYFADTGTDRRQLFLHDISGDSERELPVGNPQTEPWLDWSPAGDRLLAYSRQDGIGNVIEIDVADGANRTIHTASPDPAMRPLGWLSDGRSILLRSVLGLFRLDSGATGVRPIHTGDGGTIQNGALSPDRGQIVWRVNRDPEILRSMPVAGGDVRRVAQANIPGGIPSIGIATNWTPDGDALLATHESPDATSPAEIWIHPLDGSDPIRTELTDFRIRNLAMLKDGKTIVYQRGNTDPRVFRTQNFPAVNGDTQ